MVEKTEKKLVFEKTVQLLKNAGIEDAELEAKFIFEDETLAEYTEEQQAAKILKIAEERAKGKPLQYLLGKWEFYGMELFVGDGVLIPRQDSETLVDFCLSVFKNRQNLKIIDLCAGSGCLGLALEKNLSCEKAAAVENSLEAIEYLNKNISLHQSGISVCKGDVLSDETAEKFSGFNADIIICNPPYLTSEDMQNLQKEVSFEPFEALYGGSDGLDFYRTISRIWKCALSDGGMMIFEIGAGQEDDVSGIMIQNGFSNVRFIPDLCGINRCVYGSLFEKEKKCTAYSQV